MNLAKCFLQLWDWFHCWQTGSSTLPNFTRLR